MGGVGRGNAAEETLTKQEKRKRKLNNQDFSSAQSTENNFTGVLTSSNVPEKLESLNDKGCPGETSKPSTRLSLMYRNAEKLELRYQTLAEGGLEILESIENNEDLSDIDDASIELMEEQDLLKSQGNESILTDTGRQVYNNWRSFRDEYLTGKTDNNRLENIESELGEQSMPWFLEETSNVEITLDQYLRRKEQSRSKYDPEPEFRSIIGSIYSYDSSELGKRVRALEVLKNPEKYDEKEVSEEIQHELKHATPLGLIDGEGTLTLDGEALYRKIKTDSYYM